MTCLPSRPSQSTPDPQIHRFFYYKFIYFFVSLLSMAVEEESCCVSYSPVEAPVFWSRRRESEDVGSGTKHPHRLQLTHGCRPFSLQEVHLRALKESVKQLRNTDILLPWHIGHGMKAKSPQVWHVRGC